MDHSPVAAEAPRALDRRTLLRAGGFSALTAVFLAACGSDPEQVGLSGATPKPTLVEPTVPVTQPSQLALDEDTVQRSTLASMELLVADVYRTQGANLSEPTLAAASTRFALAHEAAAQAIRALGEVNDQAAAPNEYLRTNLVDPKLDTLDGDEAILAFMATLESALAATHLNAVGILTDIDQRTTVMSYGAAAARRVGAISPGGTGATDQALFSLLDLVPAEAYVGRAEEGDG